MTEQPEKVEGIVATPGPSREALTERELVAYRGYRKSFLRWLCKKGKKPEARLGYAHDTARNYAAILDKWHRWKWERNGFTLDLTHDDADTYLDEHMLSDENYSDSHLHNIKLALKVHFRYRGDEWETDIVIPHSGRGVAPKDFVTHEERQKLREAALEYGTIPAYHGLTSEERDRWRAYLARRFGKPMKDVGIKDWNRANGYKYVTIVYLSLDAGLRPIEVGRAQTDWLDLENKLLRIPVRDSSKNINNWTLPIREDTAEFLYLWLEERTVYEKYEDTDQLWLTRHNNPYGTGSLRVLMDNLREIAGIERDLTWYTIRHSTGTYMARREGLAASQKQLRHFREATTMKYDQVPDEALRDALDQM